MRKIDLETIAGGDENLLRRAEALRAPLVDHRRIASDAGWEIAENDVRGVLQRLASESEKSANLGQDHVHAHSWEQACEIDGLNPTIATELEFLVVDGSPPFSSDGTCLVPDYASAARAKGWDIERDFENYDEAEGDLSIRHEDKGFNDSSYAVDREGWRTCCEENGIEPSMVAVTGRIVEDFAGMTILVRPVVGDSAPGSAPQP